MIQKISDICILSDVDNTLYRRDEGIPQRNLDAIERFKSKGGRFAISTGRSLFSARPIENEIGFNLPCILSNGGAIYDFKKEEYLDKTFLPEYFKDYVNKIYNEFKDVGVVVVNEDGYFCLNDGNQRQGMFNTPIIPTEYDPDRIPSNAYKVVLSVPVEKCRDILKDLKGRGYKGVDFASTDVFYIDMLPKDVNKGNGIRKLSKIIDVPIENIITIGDYFNDVEMLSAVPVSACVEGCPQELKEICKIHVGPFENGAIADLIEYLERKYEK